MPETGCPWKWKLFKRNRLYVYSHKVNETFRTHLAKRKISNDVRLYTENSSNVIEVGKDRLSGKEGLNVGMLYCEGSKRIVDANFMELYSKQYSWMQKEIKPQSSKPKWWESVEEADEAFRLKDR